MTEPLQQTQSAGHLPGVELATLTPLVNRSLGRTSVRVTAYECKQVHGGAGEAGTNISRVYRLAGVGEDQGETLSWSLILKVIGTRAPADDPADPTYWRREALVYESGQLERLPAALAAPRYLGITQQSEHECWLWLEELIDEAGPRWSLERYGLAACHLGQFNGAYLSNRSLPAWPWLSQGWLRAIVNGAASGIELLRRHHDHPLVRRWAPPENATRILQLWDERELFLAALERLPQTLCHHDAFRRNLFARRDGEGRDQTVAIDWALIGLGAVGEEIAPIVQASLFFCEADWTQAEALEQIVLAGYLDGLRSAGWEGDPRAVQFAYAVSSALCYTIGYPVGYGVALLLDEQGHTWLEQALGLPMQSLLDHGAKVMRRQLDLADTARKLWPLVHSQTR